MSAITSSLEIAAAYLSAMIDGEGTISRPESRGRFICITNTDPALIFAVAECCTALGICFKVAKSSPSKNPNCKQVWKITISRRENLLRAAEVLQLQAPAKRARLEAAITSYEYKPPCSKEALSYLYHERELTIAELARRFGRSQTSVQHWFKRYEIPLRSQSDTLRITWRKRKAAATG